MSQPLTFERATMRHWRVMARNDDGKFQIGFITKNMFGPRGYHAMLESTALSSLQVENIAEKMRELEELDG